MKNFPSQLVVFVQGKLCSVSKLLYRAVYDWLSFISNRKLTALLCLVCFLLFHSRVAERSFLGEERHHRLALCLVQIALKLDAFASPHSLGLNPVRVASHLTSKLSQESRLAQALTSTRVYRLGLSVWFTPQTERVIVLSKILALIKSIALLLSVLLAASVGTFTCTIEQYRGISCHDNFVKAKDSSSRLYARPNVTKYQVYQFFMSTKNLHIKSLTLIPSRLYLYAKLKIYTSSILHSYQLPIFFFFFFFFIESTY